MKEKQIIFLVEKTSLTNKHNLEQPDDSIQAQKKETEQRDQEILFKDCVGFNDQNEIPNSQSKPKDAGNLYTDQNVKLDN